MRTNEVDRGFTWLRAQVQADGSVAGENASLAVPLQVRSETLHTLSLFESQQASLADVIEATPQKHTELQARKALALRLANRNAQQVITDLGLQQNADGGFGSRRTYGSNALDTAYALLALSSAPDADPAKVGTALSYLRMTKLSQSGWPIGDHPSIYATSAVLLAAQGWSTRYQVGDIIATARDWLLLQRGTNGAYGTVVDNANALLALTTQTSDGDVIHPLTAALEQSQLESGSWEDDPFVSALALRALFRATVGLPPATTGALAGMIVEAGTQTPLSGVTLAVREVPDARVATAADGSFMLLGLAPGQYTVDVQAIGYVAKTLVATVTTGTTTNTGTIALEKTALTAEVFGVVRTSSGGAMANVVVSAGTVSSFTAADGSYTLKGLNAGAATVTFAASGYRTLDVPLTLEAGKRYQLSPTLYTSGQTVPTTATVRGSVVNAATGAALSGATVRIGTVQVTTTATGTFEVLNLQAASYAITVSATGYTTLQGSVGLVAGINNLGKIALAKAPDTSTLTGLVTNAETHASVPGAVMVVQGQAATTTSGPDGRYLLSGIAGSSFTIVVSGQGYATRTMSVALPAIGQGELNVELLPIGDSQVIFESVTTNRPVYRPSDEVELEVEVRNGGDTAADLVIDAEVKDPTGNVVHVFKANARGLGQNPPNMPLRFEPGTLREVELDWVLARQTAGVYTVIARARDVSGNVRAEGTTRFTVDAMPVLAGAVIADPPLTQIDSDTPVQLKGELVNLGNQNIPAGAVNLKILLEAADTSVATAARSTVEPVVTFANASMAHLDRDAQGNFYTAQSNRVNKIAPDGTLTILATLTGASITDLAVQEDGTVWTCYARDLRKVVADGTVTRYPLVSVGTCSAIDVNAAGDVLVGGTSALVSNEQILVKYTVGAPEQVLWRNGLSQPVGLARLSSGGFAVANYGDGTVSKVSSTGVVTPFASGLNRPFDVIELGNGDLIVANSGANNLIRIDASGATSVFANGLNQPVGLLLRADGSLLVSNQGDNTLVQVSASGGVTPYAQGFAHTPSGIGVESSGAVVVANNGDGTLKALNNNTVTTLATGLGATGHVVIDSQGNKYVSTTTGTVNKVAADGSVTQVGTGLGSIGGMALQDDAILHVSDATNNRVVHLALASGQKTYTDSVLVSPGAVNAGPSGQLYIANGAFITMRGADGSIGRLIGTSPTSMVARPEGGLAIVRGYYDVQLVDDVGQVEFTARNPYYIYGMAARGNGKVALLKYNGGRYDIDEFDTTTGVHRIIATLPRSPDYFGSDLAGNLIYRFGTELYRIDQSDVGTPVLFSVNGESVQAMGVGADGKVLINTWSNNFYEIDPQSGTSTKLYSGMGWVNGITRDMAGRITVTYAGENVLQLRSNTGAVLERVDGFGSPRGLAWTGNKLLLVDTSYRLYDLQAQGALPTRLSSSFHATVLAYDATRAGTFGVGYSNYVMEWRNGAATNHGSGLPSGTYTGIATLGGGKLAIAESGTSAVYFTQLGAVERKVGGLVSPRGLALAPDGGVLVANYTSGTVLKLNGAGEVGDLVRTVTSPRFLRMDNDGTLWITTSSGLQKVAPNGTVATLPTTLPGGSAAQLYDLAFEGTSVFAIDYNVGLLRTGVSGTPSLLAGGLSSIKSVAWSPNGMATALDGNTRAVYAVTNAGLQQVHERAPRAEHISYEAHGALFTAGTNGTATRFLSGNLQTLNIGALIGEPTFGGLVAASDTQAYALAYYYNSAARRYESTIYKITASKAPDAVEVGQVVYTTFVQIPGLSPEQDLLSVDFGTWVPPYAGDFKVMVSINGIEGELTNFVHVGSAAFGTLQAQPDELPAGDQVANVRLDITGGDFTSLSRVEVARLRRIVGMYFPSGITADRAGNIYFTSTDTLYKVGVDGVQSTLATGLSVRFGLAIDANERIYFLQRNAAGRYNLARMPLGGQVETFAALDAASASGVAVDAQDNVYVAMPNRLVRVTQEGVVSTVATSGFPSPRGITIDGKGNIYVQNDNHLVAQVSPDGKVFQLYAGADGTENPVFEGDGYPNITADCSDNLYIATSQWSKINQGGEEHTIAQIVSRTGHVGLLVDTSRTVPQLTDIDYLAFDRFNNRLLLWDHSSSAIYAIPVTCGAISVDAHVFSQSGQVLSGFTVPPSASIAHADGRTEYVWSLRDVTAQGVSIDFGAPLKDLVLGEDRAVLDSAYLAFQNTFVNGEYRVPLTVPRVRVTNVIDLSVTTNKPEYAAHENVGIAVELNNPNTGPVQGTLVVDILDAIGAVVDEVYREEVMLGPSSSQIVPTSYNVGTILPAGYTVRARLVNSSLNTAEDITQFAVLPSQGDALADASLALDKAVYDPTDRVRVASTVRNRSSNVNIDNLLLMVRVYDAAGALQFTAGHDVGLLPHGATRTFQTDQVLSNAPPGTYTVRQTLQDSKERVFDTDEASYEVRSTATTGAGLLGQIGATPNVATIGEPIRLDASVRNAGNADLTAGELVIRLLDVAGETVLQTWTTPANLPLGGTQPFAVVWASSSATPGVYGVTLTWRNRDQERQLATTTFTLTELKVKLDVQQHLAVGGNVLVLVACQPADQPDEAACRERKAQHIDALLTTLGVPHMLARSVEEFGFLMRTGEYDAYWISGGTDHLGHLLANELREAVIRGDGLLVDGDHDSRNGLLNEALGLKYQGKLPNRQHTVTMVDTDVFDAGQFDITDRSIRFTPVGAVTHGRFTNGDGAVFTHQYGVGRAATFAFDFVSTIQGSTSAPLMQVVLDDALQHVLPDQRDGIAAGQLVGVLTTVRNLAADTPAWLRVQAPAPLSLDDTTPTASTFALHEASWLFNLTATQERQFMSWVRAPDADGAFVFTGIAGHGMQAGVNPLDSVDTTLAVVSSSTLREQLLSALTNLQPLRAHERNAKDQAVAEALAAQGLLASGQYVAAMEALIRARDLLLSITTVEVSDARLALSHYLGFVERRSTQS
ncbi:carboxypeptidase regulatory-like domain-containing protein [Lysobacter sp. Root494]|uniref:carboxypeptidase regulatory-like domain-containing protein n=1 Tax=Lysobacter sp. Root494 TaxID=1736549 RepID=UPI00138F2A69|nr:carboxypeptidase regulatory-like domain-containing protein [Lysobacter sp. Root494]